MTETAQKISAKMVADLRARTGAGLIDCKKALQETNGNEEEAIQILRKKGIASAAKKAGRETSEGTVTSYIHMGGRVGVLIELNCETDFVAKNENFQQIARNIAMHIAAVNPVCVDRDSIPADVLAEERKAAEAKCEDKPDHAKEKIIEGMISKFCSQVCLLEQPFVKNQDQSVGDYLKEQISKLGENIIVRRFSRFQLGE